MEIGDPERTYTIDPIELPVPREDPVEGSPPAEEPAPVEVPVER